VWSCRRRVVRATGDKGERRPREVRGRREERRAAARAIRDEKELLHRSIICAKPYTARDSRARRRWRVTGRRWGTVELRNLWSHPEILSGSPYASFPSLLLVAVHTESANGVLLSFYYPVTSKCPSVDTNNSLSLSLSLSLYGPIHLLTTSFIGLAYQGKNIVFRFIIEYSSLRDFYRPLARYVIGLFLLYEHFWKMIFWLVLKLEISYYRVIIS
jgi:hypothetical protein